MLRNPSLAQIDYIADTLKTMGIERQYNLIERNQEHHHNSFPGRIPSENVCECVKNKYILAEAIHKEAKQITKDKGKKQLGKERESKIQMLP